MSFRTTVCSNLKESLMMKSKVMMLSVGATLASATTAWAGHGDHGNEQPAFWVLMILTIQCVLIGWLARTRYLVRKGDALQPAFTELQEFSLFLLSGTVIAQIWVHGNSASYADTLHHRIAICHMPWVGEIPLNVHFLVNEVFMVFFFGIAAKELTEAFLGKHGALRGRKGLLPMVACAGGVIGPAIVFRALCSSERAGAWAVPCATDIAFSWLGARAIWGSGHPAVTFLLALAVADDFVGMGIIAAFYPQRPFDATGLGVIAIGMGMAFVFRQMSRKVPVLRKWWPYLIPGAICWMGLFGAGLHAALALVFVIPFMPMKNGKEDELFGEEDHHDALTGYEHAAKPIVDGGLFFFGLANAGVAWLGESTWSRDSWAVFLGLGVGKTIGITLLTVIGYVMLKWVRLGQELPQAADGRRMEWRDVPVAGLLGAMGFTVALFVADAAGGHPSLKLGALASFAYLGLAVVVGRVVCRR